jgi:hypothetical protein
VGYLWFRSLWIVISLVIIVISALGFRAAVKGMPKRGPWGKALLVLAIILCVVGFAFGVSCGGCAGLVLIGG